MRRARTNREDPARVARRLAMLRTEIEAWLRDDSAGYDQAIGLLWLIINELDALLLPRTRTHTQDPRDATRTH